MAMKDVMTGNRALFKIAGVAIGTGIVGNVDVSDDLGLQDVDGIGQAESVELVFGKVTHTITFSQFFAYNKKLTDLGYMPGSTEYLTAGALECEILDSISGTTMEHYTGMKLATSSRSYTKHSPTLQNATFRAIHKEV